MSSHSRQTGLTLIRQYWWKRRKLSICSGKYVLLVNRQTRPNIAQQSFPKRWTDFLGILSYNVFLVFTFLSYFFMLHMESFSFIFLLCLLLFSYTRAVEKGMETFSSESHLCWEAGGGCFQGFLFLAPQTSLPRRRRGHPKSAHVQG